MIRNNDTSSKTVTPAILSIQSAVAYGHVGNSAAVLPLQRLGFDVWPVNTVQLGHHPGYGRFCGHVVDPERLAAIMAGVLDRAPLEHCVGLLVGYLGDATAAELVVKARETIMSKQPNLVHLVDPVIGDDGPGIFVRPDVPAAIRDQLLPLADVMTPNRFELAHLAGHDVANLDDAVRAARNLLDLGPKLVIATGLVLSDRPDGLTILATTKDQNWLVTTPRLTQSFSGTGDMFSALFLGHYLKAPDLRTALERAASAIFSTVEITDKRGDRELSIIAAQDEFIAPTIRFPAIPLD